jgi:hypothetical protein
VLHDLRMPVVTPLKAAPRNDRKDPGLTGLGLRQTRLSPPRNRTPKKPRAIQRKPTGRTNRVVPDADAAGVAPDVEVTGVPQIKTVKGVTPPKSLSPSPQKVINDA